MDDMYHTRINHDFFIKIKGLPGYGDTTTLRSSKKTLGILGESFYLKIIDKVYAKGADRVTIKLRGGPNTPQLKIDFYAK